MVGVGESDGGREQGVMEGGGRKWRRVMVVVVGESDGWWG